jgi:mono/diheme cytochrome c family protein
MSLRHRGRLRLSVAALLLAAAGSALPVRAAQDAATPSRGEAVFVHRCSMCHREGQTGTVVLARRLGPSQALLEKRTDLAAPYVRQVVRGGLMNMPRISRVELPDTDLDAVVAYLTSR